MTGTSLRPIAAGDEEFLRRVYASTREEELAQTPWNEQERAEFLRFQFDAQHKYYIEQFPEAQFDVIELYGQGPSRFGSVSLSRS